MNQDTSAIVFCPIIATLAILIVGSMLYLFINQKRWARIAREGGAANAQKVARNLWRVDGQVLVGDDFVIIRFRHLSWRQTSFILPVWPAHPDIETFRRLENNDTVEFEPLSERLECAFERELCGYLRIKSVSCNPPRHWS